MNKNVQFVIQVLELKVKYSINLFSNFIIKFEMI